MKKRKQELFAHLPSEVIIEILSKLPVGSIISCKCVCKSWLALLDSHEFVKTHLPKSTPGLALYSFDSELYNLFEFEDGVDLEHHGLHYKSVTKFNIPGCTGWIAGSANGLLFLCSLNTYHALHICNPITRDYIEIDCSQFDNSCSRVVTYGFGSSKISGQHKVVRIFQDVYPSSEIVCHVYTIGTGLWRRISPIAQLVLRCLCEGTFLNGNLHWPIQDFEGPQLLMSCFDLETECFSTFCTPLMNTTLLVTPSVLEDCLCLCDNSSFGDGIAIWLMKEYGVDKSWTKQYFLADARSPEAANYSYSVSPIKIFKDGDILLAWATELLFYSKKNNTVQKLKKFEPYTDISVFIYTPNFLSLKNFGMEKVNSF